MNLICSVQHIDGLSVTDSKETVASVLIEIPHGATRSHHFRQYQQLLQGDFPKDLIDFFHVNTDIAAPECAEEIAFAYTDRFPDRRVTIVRCHIPRTFIDCNRVIDAQQSAFQEGKVTPGIPSYVKEEIDQQFLRRQYQEYHKIVRRELEMVCSNGG